MNSFKQNHKGLHSASTHKKVQKPQNRPKGLKPRDHQMFKKLSTTINYLKKPKNKVSSQQIPQKTRRSKTSSPLKQISNMQILSRQTNSKKIFQSHAKIDQNFIENLFDKTPLQTVNKQAQGSLVRNLIQSLINNDDTKQNSNNTEYFENKIRSLQKEIFNYSKIIAQKDSQIKIYQQKIYLYEHNCQNLTINAFDVVALVKKIQNQKQSNINFNKIFTFMDKKLNNLIEDINFFVQKLKLQGKIRLKAHLLQKQISQIFKGKQRSLTEVTNKVEEEVNPHNSLDLNKHYRSRSSDSYLYKNQKIDLLIDFISRRDSRRDSVISFRKNEQQKVVILRQFKGLQDAHELALDTGDRITVLKKNQNGWWIGIKNGIVGYFPASCVQ